MVPPTACLAIFIRATASDQIALKTMLDKHARSKWKDKQWIKLRVNDAIYNTGQYGNHSF